MSIDIPFGRVIRDFRCAGLTMNMPSVVACYRAGHECSTTWEELRDANGIEQRSFCACCGESYGAMGLPMSIVVEERDRLRAAVEAVRELHRETNWGTCAACQCGIDACRTIRALDDKEQTHA